MTRSGTITKAATSLFIGIPMTLGLVAALSVYCAFYYTLSLFVPKPQPMPKESPTASESESFSATLKNLSNVHAPAVQPTAAESKKQVANQQP